MVVVASAGYVPGYPTAYYTELFLGFVSTINRPAEESLLLRILSHSAAVWCQAGKMLQAVNRYKLTA